MSWLDCKGFNAVDDSAWDHENMYWDFGTHCQRSQASQATIYQ